MSALGRLASAQTDVQELLRLALAGDRIAALELATVYRCLNVTELVGVLSPTGVPSVFVFDVAADAMALKNRRDRPSRPRAPIDL